MDRSEEILISQIKAGNEKAYHSLFSEYYAVLSVFAKKYTGDLDIAKDMVQDTFVKIFEKRATLEIHTSLKSYLYQSVRNRCLNYIEHINIDRKHKTNIFESSKEDHTFNNKMLEAELEAKVFAIVAELPKKCQAIFLKSRVEGMKNKEIADQLDISVRTVEKQISNALKVLRDNLSDYFKLLIYIIIGMNL